MFTSCYKAVFTCLFCVTTAFSVFADSPRTAYEQARQHGCSEVLLRQFQARRLKGKEYDFALTYDEIWYDARTGLVRTAVSRTTDTGKMTPIEALLALAGAD